MCTSWQRRVRHEFELAGVGGIVLALQSAAVSEDVLLLCDNAAVLCAIKKWVGQGGKATLATAPDADILQEIVCLLTQRVLAGRAIFLIKVKLHRGEPINERADTLAEEGRKISDDNKSSSACPPSAVCAPPPPPHSSASQLPTPQPPASLILATTDTPLPPLPPHLMRPPSSSSPAPCSSSSSPRSERESASPSAPRA
jgi:ribonuclease HI